MKNFTPIILEKYKNTSNFEQVEKNIYFDKKKECHCVTILLELEQNETISYPFEDMIDAYCINQVEILKEYLENETKFILFEIRDFQHIGLQSISFLKKFLELEGKLIRLEKINNKFKLCVS